MRFLEFIIIALLASSVSMTLRATPQNVKEKLQSRAGLEGQYYYLDSLVKYTAETEKSYYQGLILKSELLRKENKNVEALTTLKKVSENEYSSEYPELLAKAYLYTSDIYSDQESYDLAKNYLTEAFIIFSGTDNLDLKALTLIKSADIEKRSENYSGAIRHLKQAHDIYLELGKIYASIELAEKIGTIAYQAGEFSESEQYLKLAQNGFEEIENTHEQIKVLETLSSIYRFERRNEEAIVTQEKLVTLSQKEGNVVSIAFYLEGLSKTQASLNRNRDALLTQEKAVNILQKESSLQRYTALIRLSELYRIQNRETDAILTLHSSNTLAQNLGNKNCIISSAKIISDFYRDRGEWEKALSFLALSDSIRSSLLETKIRILEKESSSNTAFIPANNTEAKTTAELGLLYNWKLYFIALCIALFTLFSILLFYIRRRKRARQLLEWKVYKRTEELKAVNTELNTYIYKSSHDLRNPLTSIKSLITLLKGNQTEDQRLKYVDLIENCAFQMDEILLNLSRAVDYKKVDVKVEQVNFLNLQEELAEGLLSEELSGIDISWEIREKAPFFSDPKLIKVILKKTILNSLQYRLGSSSDFCKISIVTDRTGASVCVEDNGQGISEKVKDSVFDMFVKGTHKSKGAGLGLYLVKIASDKIKGKISLESEENKGSRLKFNLPNLV